MTESARLLRPGDTVHVAGKSRRVSARVVNAENLAAIRLDRRLFRFDWWPSSMLVRVACVAPKKGKSA